MSNTEYAPRIGDRVRVKDSTDLPEYMRGRGGVIIENDGATKIPWKVTLDTGKIAWCDPEDMTPLDRTGTGEKTLESVFAAAQEVLDEHAIRDHFRRDGSQIRELLVEAILKERGMTRDEG